MKVYRIRDENGLWSNGGMSPEFTKSGKTWNNIGHLKSHLRQFFDRTAFRNNNAGIYANAKVVSVEIVESELEDVAVDDMILEMLEKDLKSMKDLAEKHPTVDYYQKQLLGCEDQITLIKARRDEAR